jgi:hypothetical protein
MGIYGGNIILYIYITVVKGHPVDNQVEKMIGVGNSFRKELYPAFIPVRYCPEKRVQEETFILVYETVEHVCVMVAEIISRMQEKIEQVPYTSMRQGECLFGKKVKLMGSDPALEQKGRIFFSSRLFCSQLV